MTTPHVKFFDTVNKIFPENQNDFYIDRFGSVYERHLDFECDDMENNANIIDVSFTGLFDKNKKPIYKGDILKIIPTGHKQYIEIGYVEIVVNYGIYRFYCNNNLNNNRQNTYENLWYINGYSEIIGSLLTNPELLENK